MNLSFGPCYARFENAVLTVGNSLFERTWQINASGTLSALSLFDKQNGTQWLRGEPTSLVGSTSAAAATLSGGETTHPVQNPCLCAVLAVAGQNTYQFRVFPNAPAIGITLQTGGETVTVEAAAGNASDAAPTGVELSDAANQPAKTDEDTNADVLHFAPPHLRLTQITFHDQTDHHNELVFENEWLLQTNEAAFSLSGNVFFVENPLTRSGLVFLCAAPLPYARPEKSDVPADLTVHPAKREVALPVTGYETSTIAYSGGKGGRIAALQNYQRQIRPYVPGRDGMLLSNTWGDRNRDGALTHDFMMAEIEAGARLGVDVIQIDDGWQKGATSNSVNAETKNGVWSGFHEADPQFWETNAERLPHGLAPLVEAARAKGMRFGLWFAPDSHHAFANWRLDVDVILRLFREQNIEYVKIDGVKIHKKTGERNLRSFFDGVLSGSNGRIVFDGDVTAEVRPGYFGMMDIGPLFVENRYTDWHRYWPHHTLRNIWKLGQYVDPVRLRMEFLNHARNTEKYADDPLAPHTYRADYLFATVMFTSPLGWFEVSQLPPAYFAEAAPLITLWKTHREAIHGGTIIPIGDTPDGASWTGFASVAPDRKSAHLLIFREKNPSSSASLTVPLFDGNGTHAHIEVLAGDGGVSWSGAAGSGGGGVTAHIPDEQRFVWVRLTAAAGSPATTDVLVPAP